MSREYGRLLVAGGAGFIGSNFVRLMRQTRPDTEIWVLDKLTYAGNLANLADIDQTTGYRFVHGDICDIELVDELAGHVDAMINFAAETHVDRSLTDPFAFVNADVLGTAVLCAAACKHGHGVFHLVSTDEVYGDIPEGRSKESDAFQPRSPYSASKAGGEHIASAFAISHGLPLLVTRGANTYGPYQYPEKIVSLFITNALDDIPLPLYNDGTAVRDYIHVDDHCRAIDLVLHKGTIGEAYNIGAGTETTGNEVAELTLEAVGKPQSLIQYVADRKGHDYRYALDCSKIERELGWRPTIDLRAGIAETALWYQESEVWWRPLKSADFWSYYSRNYRALEAD
jgi:dTDP-glucose 4,6-dehydratase